MVIEDIENIGRYSYDPENDILLIDRHGHEQPLLLPKTKYFELLNRNVVRLIKSSDDDLLNDFPAFYMMCLKERLEAFGIEITYELTKPPIFTILGDENHAYFQLKFSEFIK